MNRKAIVTAGVAALVVALAACDGGTSALDTVEGNRDDLRYVAPVYRMETKQVDVKQLQCKTVNKKTACKQVKVGTRAETRNVLKKSERWCVELDAVNGELTDNDRWYTVDQGTPQLASEMTEGTSIKFTPLALGC